MESTPLQGARFLVIDAGIPGLYAGRVLARFGAAVTVIEPPSGDPVRRMGPFAADQPHRERGGWWLFLAAGLESAVLNQATATGRRLLKHLQADVVIAPPALATLPAGATVVSVSPAGGRSADGNDAATPLTLAAAAGLMAASGDSDREPLSPAGPAVLVAAGLFTALAALNALCGGGAADLSLIETVTSTVIYETTAFSYSGVARGRSGPRYSTGLVLNRIVACADGYVGLHLNTQPQWRALCAWMERPDLIDDPRFQTMALRAVNVAALDAIVLPWAASRPAAALYHQGQRRRVPFSLIPHPSDVLASAQLTGHGAFEDVAHPAAGVVRLPGAPFRLDGEGGRSGRAPLLGEHTAATLARAGVAAHELPSLRAAGVI